MSVEIRNLTYIYSPGTVFEKKALDNVSLTVKAGEFLGLIGHTGSGKSTLIQHLNALLKPTYGQVFLDGEDINADKDSLKSVRQRVGLVFQYPEHQLFETTVFKDVAFGPTNLGLDEETVNARVRNALSLVGIREDSYEKSPFELSGGQKRRVAIAGVLAMEPSVLIMDEPTAGLDPRGRDEILDQIKALHREMGNTVIIVSHSMEDVARLVDRIAVMDEGRLQYLGAPREVFAHAGELEKIGLSAPQVSYLVRELNNRGFSLKEDIYAVDEAADAIYRSLGGGGR